MSEEPKSIWRKRLSKNSFVFCLFVAVIGATIIAGIGAACGLAGDLKKFVSAWVVLALIIWALIAFIHWLCFWKNFRRFLFGVACFITLIALAYVEEDWRGWHAWNQFKREQEAKGEKFDFKYFIPSPVPDDQNFAMAPIWVRSITATLGAKQARVWYGDRVVDNDTNRPNPLSLMLSSDNDHEPTNGYWLKGTLTDLKPWQDYYRQLAAKTNLFAVPSQPQSPAQDVLLALSKYDSAVEELRAASELPDSRFPIEYDKDDKAAILLPHLAIMKRCVLFLRLRTLAELQNGQTDKAFDDVKLMLHLNNSLRSEPILISQLVRIAMLEITVQPVYEGLARHQWSDAQLAELNSELSKFDFLADYEFSMRGERSFGISILEFLRHTRTTALFNDYESNSQKNTGQQLGMKLAPASFFYRSELTIAQMHQRWTLTAVDAANQIVSPEKVHQNDLAATASLAHGWPYNILAEMVYPAINGAVKKYARQQSVVDLARVAIGLERYRIANGGYPDSLGAIAGQFPNGIPHDVINGGPLNYRHTSDGQFILYSVGWNGIDDGGVVVYDKSGIVPNYTKGDLVWRYPQK